MNSRRAAATFRMATKRSCASTCKACTGTHHAAQAASRTVGEGSAAIAAAWSAEILKFWGCSRPNNRELVSEQSQVIRVGAMRIGSDSSTDVGIGINSQGGQTVLPPLSIKRATQARTSGFACAASSCSRPFIAPITANERGMSSRSNRHSKFSQGRCALRSCRA